MKNKLHQKTGASLIEFSLIVLFVGIFIAAIYQGYFVYLESKLMSAKTVTKNSIVSRLKNQVFWFETTLDESFNKEENVDGKAISKWQNIKVSTENSVNFFAPQNNDPDAFNFSPTSTLDVSGPTYIKYGINGLPSLNFKNNSNVAQFLVTDLNGKIIGNDDFYIYVIAQIDEFSLDASIFDVVCLKSDNRVTVNQNSAVNNCNPKLNMKIDPLGNVNNIITDNYGLKQIETEIFYSIKPKTYMFLLSRTFNNKFSFEVDGEKILYDKNDDLGEVIFLPIKLGRNSVNSNVKSNFNISEFIVINGSITLSQKKEIELYLTKKYNLTLK